MINPQTQTQSAPQAQQVMQPQAQPQQAPHMPPQQQPAKSDGKGKPSGREGQPYDDNILKSIEQHLNSVPPDQQAFVAKYMTPEMAIVLGIIIGNEAYDYFSKFADPSKMLAVTQRPQQGNSAATQAPQGQTPQQSGAGAQPQPQANPPQPSIMGR